MNHVFISHASDDKGTVESICQGLEAEGIPTWVSFRDIAAGTHFDQAIENAMEQASAVVVVASPSSVCSEYVRAEVNTALRLQKTVIPVIIAKANLPLRWQTLQYVKWTARTAMQAIRQITNGLPHTTKAEFLAALDDPSGFDRVRAEILRHTEWLPLEFQMTPHYTFRTNVRLAGTMIDCFAARVDSIGPRASLYYLESPYLKPIYSSGKSSPHLVQKLRRIREHCGILGQPISQTRTLSPRRFLPDFDDFRKPFSDYRSLSIHLIIGRRHHYDGDASRHRLGIVSKVGKELFRGEQCFYNKFEIMSYDRILDSIGSPRPSASS